MGMGCASGRVTVSHPCGAQGIPASSQTADQSKEHETHWLRRLLPGNRYARCVWSSAPLDPSRRTPPTALSLRDDWPRGAELGKRQVSTITLTRADSGKVVEIRAGDTLIVRLSENPTTGYQWAVDTLNADEVVLQNVEYLRAGGATVGGGGERRFTFKAQRAGTATLQLKLWRAWEGDASIVERFSVRCQVQE